MAELSQVLEEAGLGEFATYIMDGLGAECPEDLWLEVDR